MRCEDLSRWFDEGMPPDSEGEALAHASSCRGCSLLLAVLASMETALSRPAPAPSNAAAFTAGVLQRVAGAPRPAEKRWWTQLPSDPAFAVGAMSGVVLLLTPVALRLEAGQSVALGVSIAVRSILSPVVDAALQSFAVVAATQSWSPLARLYLLLSFAPLLVAAGLWMTGAVERVFRDAARRG